MISATSAAARCTGDLSGERWNAISAPTATVSTTMIWPTCAKNSWSTPWPHSQEIAAKRAWAAPPHARLGPQVQVFMASVAL